MTPQGAEDRQFLNYAIQLGRRGLGQTSPNPCVGAVVVATNLHGEPVIVGEATTADGGRPHAETQALLMAGDATHGATIYVSLEPCSHQGKTPPCTQAIIGAGIARVVCELTDPDPRVSRCGFTALENAGVALQTFAPTEASVLAHAGHIRRITRNRPFVTVKLAVSADHRIAAGDGAPVWVTGPRARARGHMLRAMHDAIVVGAETVRRDDPALTCRLPGMEGQSPIPVVLDSRAMRLTPTRLLREQPDRVIVFGTQEPNGTSQGLVRILPDEQGRPNVEEVLSKLSERGMTRVLIEGGPTVAKSFLDADVVDEMVVFQSGHDLGERGFAPFKDRALTDVLNAKAWHQFQTLNHGPDTEIHYRRSTLVAELTGNQTCSPA